MSEVGQLLRGACPAFKNFDKSSTIHEKSQLFKTVVNIRTTNGSDTWTQREIVRGEITDGRGIRRVVMQISFW